MRSVEQYYFCMSGIMVHIIESVGTEDLQERRTEGDMLAQSLLLAGMASTYRQAPDRNTFVEAIHEVSRAAGTASHLLTAIHFSCHGDQTRIALTSGEDIYWPELRSMLLPLNRAVSSTLVVGMSTCYGLFGAGMALHPHDSPFRSLVGPVNTVTFADSAIAFITFYHQLSKGMSIERAVEVMKVASGEEHFGLVDGETTRTAMRSAIADVGLQIPEV